MEWITEPELHSATAKIPMGGATSWDQMGLPHTKPWPCKFATNRAVTLQVCCTQIWDPFPTSLHYFTCMVRLSHQPWFSMIKVINAPLFTPQSSINSAKIPLPRAGKGFRMTVRLQDVIKAVINISAINPTAQGLSLFSFSLAFMCLC